MFFKEYALATPNADLHEDARKCKVELQAWGRTSQVAFDPNKETKYVVCQADSNGDALK